MAYEKQYWKDALQTAKPERSGQDDRDDKRKQKKQAQIMYKRRKIEKEIKQLLKRNPVRYKEIEEIHGKYGI